MGGLRFFFEALLGFDCEDEGEEGEDEAGGLGEAAAGVGEELLALEERRGEEDCRLRGRSIHGLSGGVSGTVYCFRAATDISHFFGVQTPTRTRQAAISLFALKPNY